MSDETVRCDTCGARNPAGATWCTQCYAAFGPPAPAPADGEAELATGSAASELPGSTPTPDPAPASVEGAASEVAPPAVQVGDVREIDGRVEWRCTACSAWVALESPICTTCGSARSGFGEVGRPDVAAAEIDARQVRSLGALFPGLGHLAAGRVGSGVTRLALGLLWLLGGVWWLVTTSASGAAPGLILLLGVVVLWVASYLDAASLAAGREERFGVRGLLWSVVGVTGLLMVSVALLATGPSLG